MSRRFRPMILSCLIAWFAFAVGSRPISGEPAIAQSTPGSPTTGVSTATHDSTPRLPRVLRTEDLKALAWRSVGPANMGGRVADIAFAPGNAKVFYVAFATGGLFKTENAGTTFSPLFDKEETASIGSVVVADAPADWSGWKDEPAEAKPADAKSTDAKRPAPKAGAAKAKTPAEERKEKGKGKIVWVGTGEGNGRNSSSWGRGVYRSTDGGGTFKKVGLTDAHDIPRLAVDPGNPDVCYAAALGHLWGPNKERGVFKTSDGGKTWKAVLQIDENTGAIDVILDPSDARTVYAAMYMRRRAAYSYQSGGPEGGIYRSRDAGATWTKLSKGLPSQTGRIGLDVYAKDPRILYAIIESDEGGRAGDVFDERSRAGGVFRSDDRGETWTRMNDHTPRPFYYSKIRVDPTNDQRVYLSALGLYVSDDGGKHFRAGGARKPHVDYHAIVIDPADHEHVLIGTDGGVYVSWDAAKTWDFLNHLAVGEFYNIDLDRSDPYRIIGGLQDNGTWMGPSATLKETPPVAPADRGFGITNADWQYVYDGDGYHCAFDPNDPNIVYAEYQGGGIARVDFGTGVQKGLRPAPKEGQPRFRFNWNTPFFVSPHVKPGQPTTLYMGGNYVFKLMDRGDRWERISGDLSGRDVDKIETVGSQAETYGTVVSLAESPLAAGMLWAGTDDGLVHVTTDDGKSWAKVTPPDVGGRYISGIEASHHARETAYVAVDGHRSDDMHPHLYRTTDAGKTWTSIVGDLPADAPVLVVREDRSNPDVLYAGTETSAFLSIDGGTRWVKLNGESLPTVAVDDIQQHPREKDLVAGTHGRSIYVLDDASPLGQLTPKVIESSLHLFDIPPGKPRLYLPYDGFWTERAFTANNPPLGASITYWLRDYTGEDVKISIENEAGQPVRSLNGGTAPGLNRVIWDLQREPFDRLPNPDADLGQKEFVPAGTYKVTVTCGKAKESKTVNVLASPGEGGK